MKISDKKNLEVSIVNYNAGQHLVNCLDSLLSYQDEVVMTISIVDNASFDDSIEKAKKKYPNLNYILNQENLGFGRAHNQVLSKTTADFVLILNPDLIIHQGVLQTLINYLEDHPKVGAVTPKIIFANGQTDLTAHRGFPTPWASLLYALGSDSLYHLTNRDISTVHEVDAITGAFLIIRNDVLKKVGLFDEDYFMYAEDIDLCFRIKEAGWKIIYYPDVEVIHFKGISSGLKKESSHITTATIETRKRSLYWFYKTMFIFYDKHYKSHYPFFVTWLVYLGIYLRWWLAKRKLTV